MAIVSCRLEACREVAAEVEAATGRRALPLAADVSQWEELEPLVERAYEELGRLDVLVSNAGKSGN